ncbi:glutamyl-tRNA reductase [Saliphagus infecundisoli]|uniref:Glutamyl-tRNA reductase n=1 Tax=Saliphagus infecundisoli TaxID=1849069 RepID=A0ABD5QHP3_9EURY|nr:glutamyl-tRNA reductase [Saliphagus infecundisoli]
MDAGVVTSARVTHKGASVDDIAAASPDSQRTAVSDLLAHPDVEEAYVLSTCNRIEAYVVAADESVGRAVLAEFLAGVPEAATVYAGHDASLRHLLRVASGLESVVVGEDQIIGQVRTAYEDARGVGGIGDLLETSVTKAIHVGERARTETAINEGVVSLGSAAVSLARREAGDLAGATALVVGAGEMARLAAERLAAAGVGELIVANRTLPHAEHVVSELEVPGEAVALPAVGSVAPRADVVVAATGSPDPVVEPDDLESGGEAVVVDLGQPRDVRPAAGDLPGVAVYDLDDIESVTENTRSRRVEAAREVEAMIDAEFDRLVEQYKRARADEVIAAMYESAERTKRREVETAIARLEENGEVTDAHREVLKAMADSLVGQLLAAPTKSLREAAAEDDWATISTALQLFDPEFGADSPASTFEDSGSERPLEAVDDD